MLQRLLAQGTMSSQDVEEPEGGSPVLLLPLSSS